jgi:antitoxin component YwqK of YwqJK toxin-antitoxin module
MMRVLHDDLEYEPTDGLYYYDNTPFTGMVYAIYPDGSMEYEGEYREGVSWGVTKEWYPEGQLAYESTCRNGGLHGIERRWHNNGVLASESTGEYGILVRKQQWNEQGKLTEEYQLREDNPDWKKILELRQKYGDETSQNEK